MLQVPRACSRSERKPLPKFSRAAVASASRRVTLRNFPFLRYRNQFSILLRTSQRLYKTKPVPPIPKSIYKMLSIQPPASSSSTPLPIPKFTPNILPCRINASGPVSASKRYWNVENDEKGRKVAYFRGRKLLGREVRIHKDYRGRCAILALRGGLERVEGREG